MPLFRQVGSFLAPFSTRPCGRCCEADRRVDVWDSLGEDCSTIKLMSNWVIGQCGGLCADAGRPRATSPTSHAARCSTGGRYVCAPGACTTPCCADHADAPVLVVFRSRDLPAGAGRDLRQVLALRWPG